MTGNGREIQFPPPLFPRNACVRRKEPPGTLPQHEGQGKLDPARAVGHVELAGGADRRSGASLSRNGYVLPFASDRPGGQGGLDLWTVPVPLLRH